jgi:hypothetical protein
LAVADGLPGCLPVSGAAVTGGAGMPVGWVPVIGLTWLTLLSPYNKAQRRYSLRNVDAYFSKSASE